MKQQGKKNKKVMVGLDKLTMSKPATPEIHPEAVLRVEFEDKMQDFLFWQLNSDGYVMKSEPFQTDIWAGTRVHLKSMKVGEQPIIKLKSGELLTLNYKVLAVQEV